MKAERERQNHRSLPSSILQAVAPERIWKWGHVPPGTYTSGAKRRKFFVVPLNFLALHVLVVLVIAFVMVSTAVLCSLDLLFCSRYPVPSAPLFTVLPLTAQSRSDDPFLRPSSRSIHAPLDSRLPPEATSVFCAPLRRLLRLAPLSCLAVNDTTLSR